MEIRFRVWDGEKMWYPSSDGKWAMETTGELTCVTELDDTMLMPDAIPMLSTGYRDLKGNEIWVGDIYRHRILGLVKVNLPDFFQYNMVYPVFHDSIVVAGNIYENPELLKEVASS